MTVHLDIDMDDVRAAYMRAARAIYEWGVVDYQPDLEPTPALIERIIDTAGAGWDLGPDGRYDTESDAEWCGYYIAAAARMVGDCLRPEVVAGQRARACYPVALRRELTDGLSSTYKIQADEYWGEYGPPHEVDASAIRSGTICIWKTGAGQEHGDHLTFSVQRPDADGIVTTLEGNGQDLKLGTGDHGEGVGYGRRSLDDLHSARELRLEHFRGARGPTDDHADDKVATTADGTPCQRCQQTDGYCSQHTDEE